MNNYKALNDAELRNITGGGKAKKVVDFAIKYGDKIYDFAKGFGKGFGKAFKNDKNPI